MGARCGESVPAGGEAARAPGRARTAARPRAQAQGRAPASTSDLLVHPRCSWDCIKRLRFLRDCSSAFNVVCQRMEQRMAYGQNEQMERVLKDALSRRRASAHGCEGFGFGLQEFRVCSHGRPLARPPAHVVRRGGAFPSLKIGSLKRVGLIALLYHYLLHV